MFQVIIHFKTDKTYMQAEFIVKPCPCSQKIPKLRIPLSTHLYGAKK